jgi:uncharacterized protein (TIGR01777 family)
MRILLTGGTGLIGRALCKSLAAAGHQLTVLSRRPATVGQKCGSQAVPMAGLAEWEPTVFFDAVINLAGEPIVDARWSEPRKKLLWDSRVALTEELVAAIRRAVRKPAVLLSGSAVGYYGDGGDRALTESDRAAADFAGELCAAWEGAALRAGQFGVRVCLLRTGLVLSRDGGLLQRMLLPFKLGLGARLGAGRQWMSWIHIDDYVAIVQDLLQRPEASGPFNLTAPNPVRNEKFTRELARVLGRPAWLAAPAFALRALLGERAGMLLVSQRVLPSRIEAQGFQFKYPKLADALSGLLDKP